jgi:H+/Na+-translocating ferredoxin:NAD+ oxidoreductase subunit A
MDFGGMIGLVIAAIFINNILLAQFLGNCPFLGVSKKMDTAIGMAGAVVFVLVLAALFTWLVQYFILVPLKLEYLQTLAFILVIATLVQFVEMFLRKSVPALYKSLGIFLPLITTNCAVMGAAILNIKGFKAYTKVWEGHELIVALIVSAAYAIGFGLALVLFAGIQEKFETARIPKEVAGTGIGLVTAGLLALSFFAFKGMI